VYCILYNRNRTSDNTLSELAWNEEIAYICTSRVTPMTLKSVFFNSLF